MFDKIMVPIDLAHTDKLEKALTVAANLSRAHDAALLCVGVAASAPNVISRTPEEFRQKLDAFAADVATRFGIPVEARSYISHDPARDLDPTLNNAILENAVDLVVMASHVPGAPEYLFASNAGYLAAHAPVSVFVVRP